MIALFVLLLVFAVLFILSKFKMSDKEFEEIVEKAAKDKSKTIFKQ